MSTTTASSPLSICGQHIGTDQVTLAEYATWELLRLRKAADQMHHGIDVILWGNQPPTQTASRELTPIWGQLGDLIANIETELARRGDLPPDTGAMLIRFPAAA